MSDVEIRIPSDYRVVAGWERLYLDEFPGDKTSIQAFMDWLKANGHAKDFPDAKVAALLLLMGQQNVTAALADIDAAQAKA